MVESKAQREQRIIDACTDNTIVEYNLHIYQPKDFHTVKTRCEQLFEPAAAKVVCDRAFHAYIHQTPIVQDIHHTQLIALKRQKVDFKP